MAIVTTTVINSILTVRNPAGNAAALTITPLTGGTRPPSREFSAVFPRVFNVFSGFSHLKVGAFLHIIYII